METGTSKNLEHYTQKIVNNIQNDRNKASHGEFFFAKFLLSNNQERKSPIFVLSSKDNDNEDVIICKCTGQPAKTQYDIPVQLKKATCVRTNKIYTINRNQLLFKIPQTATSKEYNKIIEKLKQALNL